MAVANIESSDDSMDVFSIGEELAINMTPGVTQISGQVYELHMLIFYICCAIALVVFGAMFYSIVKHRKSKGAVAAHFHESTKVEIIWTVIPIIILIAMAIPATAALSSESAFGFCRSHLRF